jgi:hypothetical protein
MPRRIPFMPFMENGANRIVVIGLLNQVSRIGAPNDDDIAIKIAWAIVGK